MARPLPLSVLDLSPVLSGSSATESIAQTVALAQAVEKMGYRRYWLAEHHNMEGIASSSPEILINQVAGRTEKIRVGSGGIMLPNHASLRIAEAFRTLEAIHPGRIDLGLGRAPGSGSRAAIALRGSESRLGADDFPAQLEDLLSFLSDSFPDRHPFRDVIAMPRVPGAPEIWILGSSDYGARLAAEMGLPYAFAQHFSTLPAKAVIDLYRRNFRPSRYFAEPRVMMAVHVVAAETDAAAAELALPSDLSFFLFRQTGKSRVLPTLEEALAYPLGDEGWRALRSEPRPKFVGCAATLRETLLPFVKDCGVDELMALTMTHDQAARIRSYEILASLYRQP